jgi:hypothetical protein
MRKKGGQEDGKRWGNGSRTMAIEVCFSFNFAVVFDFNLFPVPPSKSKAKSIGNVLNIVATWFFFLFYNTHCLLTHKVILR